MSRGPKANSHIPINCDGCGIAFFTPKCRIIEGKKYFHNIKCYRKNAKIASGGITTSKYLNHYYCESCEQWIPHEKAIMYTTTNGTKRYPICPDYENGCGKVKLATTPRNIKAKARLREQREKQQQKQDQQQDQQQEQKQKHITIINMI